MDHDKDLACARGVRTLDIVLLSDLQIDNLEASRISYVRWHGSYSVADGRVANARNIISAAKDRTNCTNYHLERLAKDSADAHGPYL